MIHNIKYLSSKYNDNIYNGNLTRLKYTYILPTKPSVIETMGHRGPSAIVLAEGLSYFLVEVFDDQRASNYFYQMISLASPAAQDTAALVETFSS